MITENQSKLMSRRAKPPARDAGATHNLSGQRLGRKGQGTRERIMKAMLVLLEGDNPAPVTLSAIAREANIGMSTLYLYFPDLGDLLLAVLRRVMDEQEAAFLHCLRTRWPDDMLFEQSRAFVRAHFEFWQRHAHLLQMRNAFADARDPRLVEYRAATSAPLISLLVEQMDVRPDNKDNEYFDCAVVLLTGLERVATVLTNPDVAEYSQLTDDERRRAYIDRLARAEARLIEIAIRDMRSQAHSV
ncbi:MAG TPA: TetR/AcrR family transcriptional regulator [Sphingobium sp.]